MFADFPLVIFYTPNSSRVCYEGVFAVVFSVVSWLQILVLNTNTQELVASFRVTTGTSNTTAIKSIEFARKGR